MKPRNSHKFFKESWWHSFVGKLFYAVHQKINHSGQSLPRFIDPFVNMSKKKQSQQILNEASHLHIT